MWETTVSVTLIIVEEAASPLKRVMKITSQAFCGVKLLPFRVFAVSVSVIAWSHDKIIR